MKIYNSLLGIAALALIASPAMADHHSAKATKSATVSIDILTNSKGMTLYTLEADKPGVSVCNGKCATLWPPHMAEVYSKNEGEFSVITRNDGGKQWAYKGRPLYTWIKDQKPGDITGHGVVGATGLWLVAQP
jgi:predicted lipoprotein with Yx(FWY)xxD motif